MKDERVIYLCNYGQTRGSNVFRDCECVVQFGTFRLDVHTFILMRKIYHNLTDEDMPLANFLQETYRGCIRCDKPMDLYCFIDEDLYDALRERIPNFPITSDMSKAIVGDIEKTETIEDFVLSIMMDLAKSFENEIPWNALQQSFDKKNLIRTLERLRSRWPDLIMNPEDFSSKRRDKVVRINHDFEIPPICGTDNNVDIS